jgi:hypothetical protein
MSEQPKAVEQNTEAAKTTEQSLYPVHQFWALRGAAKVLNPGLSSGIGIADAIGKSTTTVSNLFAGKCYDLRVLSDVADLYGHELVVTLRPKTQTDQPNSFSKILAA